ncbi:MAG: hypothetical protein ACR2FZ_07095 [Thermoleophilaceae bacterium]
MASSTAHESFTAPARLRALTRSQWRIGVRALAPALSRVGARKLLGALVALATLSPAPAALADRSAEVSIMDDQLLIGASQAKVDRHMSTFRSLGVDRLRVSAFWNQVAPANMSRTKPVQFNGANMRDPRYNWLFLDRIISSAARHRLRVMVSITTPAPIWATGRSRRPNPLWKPSANEFGAFAAAVVSRYGAVVDHWGISNEPNQGGWLQPQSDRTGLVAPHLYRALVHAAYPRIKSLDPTSVALVGELASSGRRGRGARTPIRPLRFLREMSCRNARYRPIRTGRCKNFKPVPIDALGHHPYQFFLPPTRPSLSPDDAAIGDSRRLARVLDRLVARGALAPGRGRRLSLFYTEFGYQTNPPDPFAGVRLSTQSRYIQEAAYVAWRSPRVRSLNQFRLTDGALDGSGINRFREFQSGLAFRAGRKKPAYRVFPHPFVISGNRFWGHVRRGGSHTVRVQRSASRGGRFATLAQVITSDRGYFSFRLPGRQPGYYRYVYTDGPRGTSGTIRVSR